MTKTLKDQIVHYFESFPDIKNPSFLSQISQKFNELTLELLKIFFLLLQFGFFKTSAHDFSSTNYYKEKNKDPNFPTEAEIAQDPLDEACVNNILKILAFLLEFDEEYLEDLASNHIIRGFFLIFH